MRHISLTASTPSQLILLTCVSASSSVSQSLGHPKSQARTLLATAHLPVPPYMPWHCSGSRRIGTTVASWRRQEDVKNVARERMKRQIQRFSLRSEHKTNYAFIVLILVFKVRLWPLIISTPRTQFRIQH